MAAGGSSSWAADDGSHAVLRRVQETGTREEAEVGKKVDSAGGTRRREAPSFSRGQKGVSARHATSVWQGNWFSVGIGPISKATQ